MKGQSTHTDPDERELVREAQLGDSRAFKVLYERHRDRIYNLAFYSLGDALWAEDVLQVIFFKIHRGLPGFRFESNLATWIYRITLNELQNQQRRRGVHWVPLDAVLGSEEEFDSDSPPDLRTLDNQRREIVQQVVLELSPKLRTVVLLKYFEGLSYEEIAELLDCASGTVASRLNRALKEMEARLRPLRRLL
jgi:RNA polymerase sigma-70 factor (ECF subfamily)